MAQGASGQTAPSGIPDIIAPNFKRRLSGVTSTIVQLIPAQRAAGLDIAALGPGLPDGVAKMPCAGLAGLWTRPAGRTARVWHARRNTEMVAGLILRDMLRMPVKLVFTSASQRHHKPFTKWLIGRMDAVISTSQKTAGYLERPSTVILHGIDLERFHPAGDRAGAKRAVGLPADRKIVGCFGRIRRQKGTDLFAEALFAPLKAMPEWIAIIAGRTTAEHKGFEAELRARIASEGLEDRILFVGEHTDIERWYQALDLFIAPQRWEGFGLTPLEAMACAVPVIATDVGAFSELIVEGETGHILPDLKAETMQIAAERLMADDALRETMGRKARRHVEAHFSLEREVRQLARVYDSVAPRTGTAAPR
ncbi:glycosyltransferase family 4 protein [Oricola thermophila]|uniref:Glycosyltransferase family 4 protein n=1 Tax=Oricola thermophila TaxID=2742145 RepID=A0A6N1VE57_9HYPH|nr:glycosyltransferase family 4 protein [Oricola thermophila]QKV18813.1 glycosyltransferase family 4 protein [Oricola thermophila]